MLKSDTVGEQQSIQSGFYLNQNTLLSAKKEDKDSVCSKPLIVNDLPIKSLKCRQIRQFLITQGVSQHLDIPPIDLIIEEVVESEPCGDGHLD